MRKVVKPYAIELANILRGETVNIQNRTLPYIDLADVISITPLVIIEPHHADVEYDEEDIIFQIDPDTLKVGDTVVMGRDPGGQPIVIGLADGSGGVASADVAALRSAIDNLEASGLTGDYLLLTGGTLSGNLIMGPGTYITLTDPAVDPNHAVTKGYVDALFAILAGITLIPTTFTPINYTAGPNDQAILVDTTGGPVTITLPPAHISGKLYEIKDWKGTAATNNIIVISQDGDTIDLNPSFVLNNNWQAVTLSSDGTNWSVV